MIRVVLRWLVLMVLAGVLFAVFTGNALAASSRQIPAAGTTSMRAGAPDGSDGVQWPEFPHSLGADEPNPTVGRTFSTDIGAGPYVTSGKREKSNPEVQRSFDGLNHRNQRLANGGNQFSLEPPDQGLCVGNGFVMEPVNDIVRVYDKKGNPLTNVIDLNTFYGYPAQFNRSTGAQGPFVTDPSCHYDPQTQRWFLVVLTLDVDPATGDFTGTNHLDLAVSKTSSPTGDWNIYRIPAQDDGTQGTPDHHCNSGLHNPAVTTNPLACFGDYPHIGADANGFYITTNEYDLFGPAFQSANIYAISKKALATGASAVTLTQFETKGLVASSSGTQPGFTVWPAISPGRSFAKNTEYFLSSNAAEEANGVPGGSSSNELIVWSLSNTSSLDSFAPAPVLSNMVLSVGPYDIPPKSDQKPGDTPLGQCINDTTFPSPFGPGCWQFFFVAEPAHDEKLLPSLDSNDTRMQQVVFAHGNLWGALDTAVNPGGGTKAGIEWFAVDPSGAGAVVKSGYLGLANNNLTYPAIGVTQGGHGVMAFTLVGADYYPSAAYAGISARAGVGPIHVVGTGKGPDDGFSNYKAFVGDPPRVRWGDYGAAAMDGDESIWIASEYIAQTCTFAQYTTTPFGSCGGTRTSLANWATRISRLEVGD